MPTLTNLFHQFKLDISQIELPEQFNFPFYYEPHELCRIAAEEVQQHLLTQTEWEHNFGLDDTKTSLVIGKMFGVLVVKTADGQLGYLRAFSGKMAEQNHLKGFVPPLFDMLPPAGYYKTHEAKLNIYNREIEALENNLEYHATKENLNNITETAATTLADARKTLKIGKKDRKTRREAARHTVEQKDFEALQEVLKDESLRQQYEYKLLVKEWDKKVQEATTAEAIYSTEIARLKAERKDKSNTLQQWLFGQYSFLNIRKEQKNLTDIFTKGIGIAPPAGAGECAAPKLFQYAFQHDLTPVCMAEFWWGTPPKSAVRKHKGFYPACRSKCEPILGHMLEGMNVEPNPMLENPALGKKITTLYEDDHILVVNKPAEFLSVPGRNIKDSVAKRIATRYPDATGPLLVHRLDMSTSGIILIAKTKEHHQYIQYQFIKRRVKKRYIALLDGLVKTNKGIIDLPLRVDIDNRPHQLVCHEHGKPAQTEFEVIERKDGKTRVYFYPITGRTHQLRVHAAHPDGLNAAIVGDDLYGTRTNRLHLHAESLTFVHPETKEEMTIVADVPF